MGFEGFPQSSFNLTVMSLFVAALVTVVCLTVGKTKRLKELRILIFSVFAVGSILSILAYRTYTFTTQDINFLVATGPSLLVSGLYGALLSFLRPEFTLKRSLGVFILLSPLIAGVIWVFAYEFISVHNY